MRTSCPIPTAITAPIGTRDGSFGYCPGVRFAARPQTLCIRTAHAVSGLAWWSVSWWLLAALCALALLGGCTTTLSPGSASIVDAVVVPAIPPPEAPPVACLPVPDMPPPPTARLSSGAVAHKPVPRPVHRVRPPRRADEDVKPAPEETPAPPPAPAPLVVVRDLPHGQFRGLLDAEVLRGGNVVGRAVDAVADAHGRPRQIVINLAGFMGVGDRKVSLSWDAFRFNTVIGKPLLILKSNTIDPVASAPASGGSPAPPAGGVNLMDGAVSMRDGAAAGRVVDVLVDAEGHARAVVLDVSTSLIHEKLLIAADWSALHVVSKGATVRLETDLDARQLEASPRYEPGQAAHIVTPAGGAAAASGASAASAVPTASASSAAMALPASPAATARPASAAATASASAVSAARASK